MRRSVGRNPRSTGLMRGLAQQTSFFVFLAISIGLLVFSRINPSLTNQVQGHLVDAAAPVVETLGRPVGAVRDFGGRIGDVLDGAEEVESLRVENEKLRRWRDVALQLDRENAKLRGLMRVRDDVEIPAVTSRVISDPGGPFLRAVILDQGGIEGVSRQQPVLDGDGVVGRVVTVGETSSRALLVTDFNSRIPVVVERTGDKAIMTGDNSSSPRLAFLPMEAAIIPGDEIYTSGDGGVFPPWLKVGTVESVSDGMVRVRPAADLSRLEYVNVLAYEPPAPPEANPVATPLEGRPEGAAVAEGQEGD